MTDFTLHNGSGRLCLRSCGRQDRQLNTYDWLADIPGNEAESEYVEVQFKNTRKGYFRNSNRLELAKGDIVAVEATPGHDIGVVTLTGRLVPLQMKKTGVRNEADIRRIYRKAKAADMEKYAEAKAREHSTMIRARQIALSLGLDMKIGDVEYQGDGNKAIFYYIAEGRVDFRQLIKVLAEAFRVRIEMKQIGARQEAGRIGGIGPCGRELCCATWMTSFVSVSTGAARYQDISYVEAQKRLPSKEITLRTKDAEWFYFKADILAGQVTYSSDKSIPANLVTIPARRAFEVINMNRKGAAPDTLAEADNEKKQVSADLLEQESVTRFDRNRKGKGGNENKGGGNGEGKKKKKKNKGGGDAQAQDAKQEGTAQASIEAKKENKEASTEKTAEPSRSKNRRNRSKKNAKPADKNDGKREEKGSGNAQG